MAVATLSALPDHTPGRAVLWRILGRRKLDAMIEQRELYFCRADRFSDDDEGIPPEELLLRYGPARDPLDVRDRCELNHQYGWYSQVREQFYISCWHLFQNEELRLWDTYGGAVAIETTVQQLKQQLQSSSEEINMFAVRYDAAEVTSPNLYQVISYKRARYAWELEFRCVISRFKESPGLNRHIDINNHAHPRPLKYNPPLVQLPCGYRVPVNLDRLVNRVVLGPRLNDDDRRSISNSIREAGIAASVVDSQLRPSALLVLPDPVSAG